MEQLKYFFDLFMHLDKHLSVVIQTYGVWTYSILFVIVFCETGLVVTPILPGDSLLFAAGAFAATGSLNVAVLFGLLAAAAILGDTVNYQIGHLIGPKVFHREDSRFLKKEYLERTHKFYEKYGGKTIIIARFVPIIRTFAPFVAGVGAMTYSRFIVYNVIGGIAWVILFVFGGYYFGNLPLVKKNFSLVILAIIVISVMPGVIEFLRARYGKNPGGPQPALGTDCPAHKSARNEAAK
jgi:membrane-associated protein